MPIIDRSQAKPTDKPYMTRAELADFERLRKDGSVTFFRTAKCRACKKEIHQTKQFCSQACYEKGE